MIPGGFIRTAMKYKLELTRFDGLYDTDLVSSTNPVPNDWQASINLTVALSASDLGLLHKGGMV